MRSLCFWSLDNCWRGPVWPALFNGGGEIEALEARNMMIWMYRSPTKESKSSPVFHYKERFRYYHIKKCRMLISVRNNQNSGSRDSGINRFICTVYRTRDEEEENEQSHVQAKDNYGNVVEPGPVVREVV